MSFPGKVLLPTAYFPPVSWFAYLVHAESVWIEVMETYHKQTYRNRCEIMTVTGKENLVVPVTRPQGNHTLTRDIEICYREHWQQRQWKTLLAAYSSSPFFYYYADTIRPFFEIGEHVLVKHNHELILALSRLTGIEKTLRFTTEYEKKPDGIDLRSSISPKKHDESLKFPEYPQVFGHLTGFIRDLSILDLLFNLGPDSSKYLEMIDA